jgi:hypothetical protein
MLPGFRFLLAAILLCISILVFGLGAAALLRTAHEEFAQNPSWRASPEPRFAQAEPPAKTVLAMLRVEPTATEIKTQPKTATDAPINTLPAEPRVTPSEAPAITSSVADEDRAAAPHAQESSTPVEIAKAEASSEQTPASEQTSTPASEQTSIPAEETVPASTASVTDKPAAADTKIAAIEQASPAASEQPAATEPVTAPAAPEPDPAVTKVATLGDRPIAIEPDAQIEKETAAEQEREEAKKRTRAEHARERRLAARRMHLARQRPARPQQTLDLFGQQTVATRGTR